MNSTGIIRPVDKMGRVVIPKEIRAKLQIKNDVDSFEIFLENDKIILKKFRPTCVFCNTLGDCVDYEGYSICGNCIEKLKALKESEEI